MKIEECIVTTEHEIDIHESIPEIQEMITAYLMEYVERDELLLSYSIGMEGILKVECYDKELLKVYHNQ